VRVAFVEVGKAGDSRVVEDILVEDSLAGDSRAAWAAWVVGILAGDILVEESLVEDIQVVGSLVEAGIGAVAGSLPWVVGNRLG
jgi:hypothetical protein